VPSADYDELLGRYHELAKAHDELTRELPDDLRPNWHVHLGNIAMFDARKLQDVGRSRSAAAVAASGLGAFPGGCGGDRQTHDRVGRPVGGPGGRDAQAEEDGGGLRRAQVVLGALPGGRGRFPSPPRPSAGPWRPPMVTSRARSRRSVPRSSSRTQTQPSSTVAPALTTGGPSLRSAPLVRGADATIRRAARGRDPIVHLQWTPVSPGYSQVLSTGSP